MTNKAAIRTLSDFLVNFTSLVKLIFKEFFLSCFRRMPSPDFQRKFRENLLRFLILFPSPLITSIIKYKKFLYLFNAISMPILFIFYLVENNRLT